MHSSNVVMYFQLMVSLLFQYTIHKYNSISLVHTQAYLLIAGNVFGLVTGLGPGMP